MPIYFKTTVKAHHSMLDMLRHMLKLNDVCEKLLWVYLDEFKINEDIKEIFLSIKINNVLDILTESDFNKKALDYAEKIKNIFGIGIKPEIKKFNIMRNLWVIHMTYKLPDELYDSFIKSAEMLYYINNKSSD